MYTEISKWDNCKMGRNKSVKGNNDSQPTDQPQLDEADIYNFKCSKLHVQLYRYKIGEK